jgi:DNA repair ATPase RecN
MKVEKSKHQDTSIEMLSDTGRVDELARMLGGRKITDETKDFARTLLADAHN